MTPNRTRCCVPFCRRTRGIRKGETELPSEWVCGEHWSAVPKRERRRLSRAYRWYTKRFGNNAYWSYPPGTPDRIGALRYSRHWQQCWERCKRAAIEMAVGI